MFKSRLIAAVAPLALLSSIAVADDQTVSQSFQAKRVQIDALVGNLKVIVADGYPSIDIALSGTDEMVQKVRLSTSGDAVVMAMEGMEGDWWDDMWDWSSVSSEDLTVTIKVSTGTPIRVDNYIGDADIGDLNASLKMNTSGGEVRAGNVSAADVAIAGSGDIRLGHVAGDLDASIAGSGSVRAGDCHSADVEIAGGGEVKVGTVNGDFDIDIAGSGEVYAIAVNGKVNIDVAGSGDVKIDGGVADPFKVDIAGSGDVRFGGTANNPDVSVMGSGDVWIAAYTGTLSSDGADIKIGKAE
ncbi:MAG: DUF2807 domain-containing protein [Micropepsaceae bacterium]